MGLQFGLLALWITPHRLAQSTSLALIPSFWVLIEWTRLFLFSGFTWNPIGLSLAAHPFSLQAASLLGIYGLSFWVIWTALLFLRRSYYLWAIAAIAPYLFGWGYIAYHESKVETVQNQPEGKWHALLVQTAFPIEETLVFRDFPSYVDFVLGEWMAILELTAPHKGKQLELLAFPEFAVPFAAYSPMYPLSHVEGAFKAAFGEDVIAYLPHPTTPFGEEVEPNKVFVSNAYFAQALANLFNASVLIGMEDGEKLSDGTHALYSAALHFKPQWTPERWPPSERYAKQVLLPMGEYIPFAWCKELALSYGISGSFTPGTTPSLFRSQTVAFSPSICYEETFANLIRKSAHSDVDVLINLTNDGWYPQSKLARQHAEHARLRTVESGLPLLRACNTGVTCGIDSFGKTLAELGQHHSDPESLAGALVVEVPRYKQNTIYAIVGDAPLLGFAFLSLLFFSYRRKRKS